MRPNRRNPQRGKSMTLQKKRNLDLRKAVEEELGIELESMTDDTWSDIHPTEEEITKLVEDPKEQSNLKLAVYQHHFAQCPRCGEIFSRLVDKKLERESKSLKK